jgi:hypothetical protein
MSTICGANLNAAGASLIIHTIRRVGYILAEAKA